MAMPFSAADVRRPHVYFGATSASGSMAQRDRARDWRRWLRMLIYYSRHGDAPHHGAHIGTEVASRHEAVAGADAGLNSTIGHRQLHYRTLYAISMKAKAVDDGDMAICVLLVVWRRRQWRPPPNGRDAHLLDDMPTGKTSLANMHANKRFAGQQRRALAMPGFHEDGDNVASIHAIKK